MQIAENLKGGGRNGVKINVRIRKIEDQSPGISTPIILGEATRDSLTNPTTLRPKEMISEIKRDGTGDINNRTSEIELMDNALDIKVQMPETPQTEKNEELPKVNEVQKNT